MVHTVSIAILCLFAIPRILVAEFRIEAAAPLHASVFDDAVSGTIRIVNSSDKRIHIDRLIPSCGCTNAKVDKEFLNAGESGVITVNVKLGDHVGRIRKYVAIVSDDSSAKPFD